MDNRRRDLLELKTFVDGVDNELTLILQCLQWDKNHLLQKPALISCKYDINHKIPPDKCEEHEKECFLTHQGYYKDDLLLPEPLDTNSATLVKLRKEEINMIIEDASKCDPSFKRVIRKTLYGL